MTTTSIGATIACTKCGGTGEPAKLRPGFPDEKCSRCDGSGTLDRGHYAYCMNVWCLGCRPSLAEIANFGTLHLWGEMLGRCLPQTPRTKTREGAIAAITADDHNYSAVAFHCRRAFLAEMNTMRLTDTLRRIAEDRRLTAAAARSLARAAVAVLGAADGAEVDGG